MDASYVRAANDMRLNVEAAAVGGELRQLADGRAAVMKGLNAAAANDLRSFETDGIHAVAKVAGVVIIDGAPVWWAYASNGVTPVPQRSGRGFFAGTAVCPNADAASGDPTVAVNLNRRPIYNLTLGDGNIWYTEATLGLGNTLLAGGGVQQAFDAVAEVAQAALYSDYTFPVDSNPIAEILVAVYDKGDNAALDIDLGLASDRHASDFESVANFVAFHLDGNDLSLKAHSDDSSTDVPITDTTIDLVDDTYAYLVIDCRDKTNCKLYANGVRMLSGTTFTLEDAAGPLKAVVMMEKTNDDTVADVRVAQFNVRTAKQ
jgi:hypothetical protein